MKKIVKVLVLFLGLFFLGYTTSLIMCLTWMYLVLNRG